MDPVGAEVNVDAFLFEQKNNFFAKSNNKKLQMAFKGKDLNIAISGLENQLKIKAEMIEIPRG